MDRSYNQASKSMQLREGILATKTLMSYLTPNVGSNSKSVAASFRQKKNRKLGRNIVSQISN